VDLARSRIALTMKLDAAPPAPGAGGNTFRPAGRDAQPRRGAPAPAAPSAMAEAFARLQGKR
jgi:uncharacterized protein